MLCVSGIIDRIEEAREKTQKKAEKNEVAWSVADRGSAP